MRGTIHARFEPGEVGLGRELVTVPASAGMTGGGGLAQRFGVRFGLFALDSGCFEAADGFERAEGGGAHGDVSLANLHRPGGAGPAYTVAGSRRPISDLGMKWTIG